MNSSAEVEGAEFVQLTLLQMQWRRKWRDYGSYDYQISYDQLSILAYFIRSNSYDVLK